MELDELLGARKRCEWLGRILRLTMNGGVQALSCLSGLWLWCSRNAVAEVKSGKEDGSTLCSAAATSACWVDSIDWERICAEHRRGTTLEVLWEEEA